MKPQGACRGDVCVPFPPGPLSPDVVSDRLGMPLVRHDATLAALGPSTLAGKVVDAVEVPDFELLNFDGDAVRLADVRGSRTVVVSWAPW